jgi:hypothetical protein
MVPPIRLLTSLGPVYLLSNIFLGQLCREKRLGTGQAEVQFRGCADFYPAAGQLEVQRVTAPGLPSTS